MAGGVHGRGCVWWGACVAGGMHGGGAACYAHPPPANTMRYSDTVNERAVHILLECILVNNIFHIKHFLVFFVPRHGRKEKNCDLSREKYANQCRR